MPEVTARLWNQSVRFWVPVLTTTLHGFSLHYWRIIALQCGGGLCHLSTRISHNYTYIPSLSLPPHPPFHPSRLLQSTGRASCVTQQLPTGYVLHNSVYVGLPWWLQHQVRSLGREDPLEKETATRSSTLAWRIPRMEEPGGLQSTGSQRVAHDWVTWFLLLSGYMSMLLSQFVTLSPSSTVCTSLFSRSASPFLLCELLHHYYCSRFPIYVLIYDICFSLSGLLHSV